MVCNPSIGAAARLTRLSGRPPSTLTHEQVCISCAQVTSALDRRRPDPPAAPELALLVQLSYSCLALDTLLPDEQQRDVCHRLQAGLRLQATAPRGFVALAVHLQRQGSQGAAGTS